MEKIKILVKSLVAISLLGIANASVQAAALVEVAEFGSNPGKLRMYEYVPATLPSSAPLVVALHGCTQSASNFDDETGWAQFAERWGFALLLPEQQEANNSRLCFNWFQPDDTTRAQGEPLSIYQMIEKMKDRHSIDPERIYVTGLSAGGAMAAVMLATYPELFAGGAIIAGVPYHCASSLLSALWCQWWGRDLAPREWAIRCAK